MKVIIVGMDRMGRGLALRLEKMGNQVVAVDKDPVAFEDLPKDFSGRKIVGSALDKRVLKEMQIDRVDATVACTNNDELNAVYSRTARNVYHVPHVIARLYDPRKSDIYSRLGIQTVSPTRWGIDRIMNLLSYDGLDSVYDFNNGQVKLVRVEVPQMLVGQTVDYINMPGEIHLVAIERKNTTFMPVSGTEFEKNDALYVTVKDSAVPRLKDMFSLN